MRRSMRQRQANLLVSARNNSAGVKSTKSTDTTTTVLKKRPCRQLSVSGDISNVEPLEKRKKTKASSAGLCLRGNKNDDSQKSFPKEGMKPSPSECNECSVVLYLDTSLKATENRTGNKNDDSQKSFPKEGMEPSPSECNECSVVLLLDTSLEAPETRTIQMDPESDLMHVPKCEASPSTDDSKENIKLVESAPESDGDQDDSFDYLKMRERNVKANEEFFASLGLNKAKELFQTSVQKKKAAPTQRGLKIRKEPQEPLPLRQSMRIRRIDPAGNQLPEPEPVPESVAESRLPAGPVNMSDCLYSKSEEITPEYMKPMSSLINQLKPAPVVTLTSNDKPFLSAVQKVSMTEDRVAKVVPGRVFSLVWHPSPNALIAVAGDKYGHIGLWDVSSSEKSGEDVVRAFRPHIKPVSDLFIPPTHPHKLYSCSYDSTLRAGDFEREIFDDIFSVPEEDDDLFRNFNFVDGVNSILVSQFSGNVSLVDTRTPKTSAEHVYPVSRKSLRTVSVHPNQRSYFVTAGVDANINLWDLRSINTKSPKPVQTLKHHTKAIASAYFSPSGHQILSSAADDYINLYSVSDGMKLELSKNIRHNNHTGRWLTKFQPNWHPSIDNVFVSGSMNRPREIQIFSGNGSVIKALTSEDYLGSVCSLNVFHPHKLCTLVGANSSGRLHVFM